MRVYKEKPLFLNNGPQAGNPLILPRPPLPPPSSPKIPRLSSAATPINFSPGGLHVVILDLVVVVVVVVGSGGGGGIYTFVFFAHRGSGNPEFKI